jgi:competence protein ComEA
MKLLNLSKSLLLAASLIIFNPSFAEQPSSTININNATIEQLVSIKGIGSKKAQAIIDFRSENGDFVNLDDLTKVKGISSNFINKNRATLTVGSSE